MSIIYAGDTIYEIVQTGQVGDTITAVYALKPNGSTFSFSQTSLGSGDYQIAIPTAVGEEGRWLFRPQSALNPGDYQAAVYDVEAAATASVVTPVAATTGTTLQNLRRRIARRLGDLTICTATSDGNTTTFYDPEHLKLPDDDFASYSAYVASGNALNVGEERTVTGSAELAGTLTVSPAFPASLLTGTVLELHNERGIGWTATEKHEAINAAIMDAAGMGGIEISVEPAAAFDQDSPTIAVPATMTRLFLLEYQDTLGNWVVLPKAGRPGAQGWWANVGGGTIDVAGVWRYNANARSLRLRGFGQFSELSAESNTTLVNPLYIVPAACLMLLEGGLDRDPARQGLIPIFKQETDRWRRAATRVAPPNTTMVRA